MSTGQWLLIGVLVWLWVTAAAFFVPVLVRYLRCRRSRGIEIPWGKEQL